MLAALNHPNIAVIHGIEDADGAPALVLELVEGLTLAERLARPIPVTEALTIARQIADALEAAHDKGIIHRDLKPANIKITSAGVVKVLDFGLAKVSARDGAGPDLSQSPTVTAGGTRDGMILGTPAYMSPEQTRGQAVDERADIWAFGCVLYEMIAGRTAFAGDTVSDTIAAILDREVNWGALPVEEGETRHAFPFFLPDGRHFLYLAVGSKTAGGTSPNGIYVTTLDSNERKLLVPGGSNPMYAQGYLFFLRGQTLIAQPFDVERLKFTGDAVPIAERVGIGGQTGAAGGFTVSQSSVLAYETGSAGVGDITSGGVPTQLVWFDRSGKQIGVLGEQARSGNLRLAPDGRRAAVSVFDLARRTRDIWLFDIPRGLRTRFTFDPADEFELAWSPDGSRVVFDASRKGPFDLYQKASSGAGAEEELLTDSLGKFPVDWSPDGRFILFVVAAPKTGFDLWVLPLFGDRKPFQFLQTQFNERGGQFSADGRWVAYVSDESGRPEVYVAPFPGPGGKWQVSTTGGTQPRYRRDGKEIFYLAPDNKLMAAAVNGQGSAFEVGAVRPLFDTRPSGPGFVYDVAPDGQRFLVNTLTEEVASAPITLVVNWPALLKK